MKPFLRYLLYSLVAILLLANTFMLIRSYLDRPAGGPGRPPGLNAFLIRELKLDEDQAARYEVLVSIHRHVADSIRREIRESKERMFSMLRDPMTMDSAWDAAAQEGAGLAKNLDLQTMAHFREVRQLCRPDQQRKFDSLLAEVAARMAGGPPPGPPLPGFPPPPR